MWCISNGDQSIAFIKVKYKSTNDGGGCCVSEASTASDNYHRSCLCPKATNISECERLCSEDKSCKGYAQHSNSKTCKLATTSLCSVGCHGPYNKNNFGGLDIAPKNCAQGEYNGGCYVKQNGNK